MSRRRGSTLVIVLALLALLSILGLAFVTFSGSERISAENYSGAAEREFEARPRASTRVLTRFATDRLLSGPRANERNSALSGGRHTLLASLFGNDVHPHSGQGVNVIGYKTGGQETGYAIIDQNHDGTADSSQALMELNDSRSANNGTVPSRPAPDVDYTAPDINSVFLAFNGFALDSNNRPVHVIIPSFSRPQYIRGITSGSSKATPVLDWETRPGTVRRVLRPHPMHKDFGPTGNSPRVSSQDPQGLRYVITKAQADRLGLSGPFPFGHTEDVNGNGTLDAGEDRNDNGFLDTEAHHGVWTLGAWQQSVYYRSGQWVVFSEDSNGNNSLDPGEDTIAANNVLDRWYFRAERAGVAGNSMPTFGSVNVGGTTTNGGGAPIWKRFARFQPRYEFDADADGDGIKEAIWLDLDFPVQSLGNGKKAIPLFALTIYDAGGLMNLNANGNISGTANLGGATFGGGKFISRSNLGMSPSEINPQWGLDAGALSSDFPASSRTTGEVFQDHRSFFNHVPTDWIENANMEWWFLLKGRGVHEPGSGSLLSLTDGRHGDITQLAAAIAGGSTTLTDYPQPGTRGADDNFNSDEGEQAPPFDVNRLAEVRPYVHPLDFRGAGTSTVKIGSLFQPQFFSTNRHKFLQYTGYQAQQVSMAGHTIKWGQALSGSLMQSTITTPLIDEETESVVDERNRQGTDRLFDPRENFFLQASRSDLESAGFDSRLARLAGYNFQVNTRSEKIRRRYTVDSWDTRDFVRSFPGVISGLDKRRAWEFWATNGTNRFGVATYAFPPKFTGASIGSNTDPFRDSIRTLLELVANRAPIHPTDSTLLQRRLSPNHLLDRINGNVEHRRLTQHPQNPGTGIVPVSWNVSNTPAYPPANMTQQEWWARYDRQRMARDIYVLLYTLCGGSDQVNYTSTNDHDDTLTQGNNLDRNYTTEQLREMAQFAVNVVDAMDSDNVVTRFEYDKNLGPTIDSSSMMVLRSGWNLDDNPWTNDGFAAIGSGDPGYDIDHPSDHTERGVVHGVEAQQLTLSEFFAARTTKVTDPDNGNAPFNHDATLHDDKQSQVFAGIEIRNNSPFDLPLSAGNWRIELRPITSSPAPGDIRRVTLRSVKQVEAATAFSVISCADDQLSQGGSSSTLNVDPDNTPGAMQVNRIRIFPRTLTAIDVLDLCLDSAATAAQSPFRISNGSGTDLTPTVGSLLTGAPFTTGGGISVRVILQRRMHPDRTTLDPLIPVQGSPTQAAYDLDNPWIEVDRMDYVRTAAQFQFSINKKDNDTASTTGETHNIRKQLWELRSRQRPQPFHRSGEAYMPNPAGGANAWRTVPRASLVLNSVGTQNTNSPAQFDRWQPHFDRPFASLVDLFDIPIYGPHDVTSSLDNPGTHSAGYLKFLRPDYPNNTNADPRLDNRWVRLLNFLEIPTRTDHFLNGVLPDTRKYRIPGRLNLNTVRHPHALGGLIDRKDVCVVAPAQSNSHLPDATGETSRDWWSQLILSRDGYDPVSELFLPGMAHGHPFRSPGLTHFGVTGLEQTLFRSIPLDTNTTSGYVRRRLFQLGTQGQHNNQSVHHHTRHRLLSKIHGNTTTRSNVFFVFLKVDWFECHQDSSQGHVRIGARLPGAESQRSFFVVDRSRALELLQPDHIPSNGTYNIGTGTGPNVAELDAGPMILYQQVIE